MKLVVAQVVPKLCLTREEFINTIDNKIGNIIKEQGDVDLIIFPEALGLWMCLMEPTTWLMKVFSIFLHSHKQNSVRLSSIIASNTIYDYSDEIIVNLQFARPDKKLRNIVLSDFKCGIGLLDCLLFYSDLFGCKSSKASFMKSKIENLLIKISNWLFSKIKLRFISQYLRSNEILSTYKMAFSRAARKYNIYIQAGSIFERVVGGTKNIAYVFGPNGTIICKQEKWHPIAFEGMLGIIPGNGYQTFTVKNIKCGIAICNDLGFPNDLVAKLASEGCKFIASPSGGIVPTHLWSFDYYRDIEICQQARANESNVIIGRAYNAGDLLNGLLKFQGLSNIVKPGGLVSIVPLDKIKSEYNLKYEVL